MSKKLTDTDENEAVKTQSRAPSVPVDLEELIDLRTDKRLSKHMATCPAAKAYQRMVGVAVAFGVVIGFIVWLGQNATEKKIDDAVEAAFQRRLPYLRMLLDKTVSTSLDLPPATEPQGKGW